MLPLSLPASRLRSIYLPLVLSTCLPGVIGCAGGTSPTTTGSTTVPVQPTTNPAPAITSVSPASIVAGSPAQTLSLIGTGFLSSSTATFDGASLTATFVSATSLQVVVPASGIAASETATIVITNPAPGGGASPATAYTVLSPTPAITSLSPTQAPLGAALTVTINGSGFEVNSSALWNGSIRPTTFVNGTTLKVALTAADLQTIGVGQIVVNNPGPGSSATAPTSLPVIAPLVLTAISPVNVAQDVALTLTLTGSGFQSSSTALWNGSPRPTTVISSTLIRASLTAADLGTIGAGKIAVSTPLPGGSAAITSGTLNLNVLAPPAIVSLSPSTVPVYVSGSTAVAVTLTGTNFAAQAKVYTNGSSLPITSQSVTQIVVSVPINAFYSSGLLPIIVVNPPVSTGDPSISSAVANLTLINPGATFSVSPAYAPAGSPALTINLYGAGFFADSVVQWNSQPLVTTNSFSGSLTATVPAALLANLGIATISVATPENQGKPSSTQPFGVFLPLPVNDLAWNAADGLIYATVAGSGGPGLGNSLVGIDPNTGVIQKTIFVGSEPNRLALSTDGLQAFVGLNAAGAVRQVNLQTATAGTQFSLGGGSGIYNPPYTAANLAVPPGQPNSVAVYSSSGVVTIYDSGIARPKTSSGLQTYFSSNYGGLTFGSSAANLFVSSEAIGSYVYNLAVDATGITASTQLSTTGSGRTLQYDKGVLYFPVGIAADATTGATLGQFSTTQSYSTNTVAAIGPIVSDSTLNRAWIVANNFGNAGALLAFDETTFNQVAALPASGTSTSSFFSGTPADLIRWGTTGLAFHTGNQLYIFQGPLVKDNSASPADLAVTALAPVTATTGMSFTSQFQVSNLGPNSAQGVTLTAILPSSLSSVTVSSTQGSCSGTGVFYCDLGTLANGANATVTVTATPLTARGIIATVTVAAQSYDPAMANNQVNAPTVVSGPAFGALPSVSSLTPNFVAAGAGTFTLTVNGAGFNAASTVLWNGVVLPSTFVNAGQLTATVDASLLRSLGWAQVSVSSPAPGGGQSTPLTLSIYNLLKLPASAIAYDPFTRKIYAALPSTSTTPAGNSLIAIDPATGALGQPVAVGSEPNLLAETTSGNYLYVGLSGAQSLGRFNLLTQALDLTVPLSGTSYLGTSHVAATGLSTLPGVDSSVYAASAGIVDITGSTATVRSNTNVGYNNTIFTDPTHFYTYDNQSSGAEFYRYSVGSTGAQLIDATTLLGFGGFGGTFALDSGRVYASSGGIVDPSTTPPSQIGVLPAGSGLYGGTLYGGGVVPYAAEGKSFNIGINSAGTALTFLTRYDTQHFVQEDRVQFPSSVIGPGVPGTRWGQDGLAFVLPSSFGSTTPNQVLLMRGPFVLPAEAFVNPAPALTSAGSGFAAGAGNQQLVVRGSGFLPGATVSWNGTALSTTYIDAQHLSAAIGASDIKTAGAVSVAAQNPGSGSSNILTVTVQ